MNKILLNENEKTNREIVLLTREAELWLNEGMFNIGVVSLKESLEVINRAVETSSITRTSRGILRALTNIQECFLILGYDRENSISEFWARVSINAYQQKIQLWRNKLSKITE